MKINVGIVGYGNLGKALEQKIKESNNFNLVSIFSKRKLSGVEHISKISKYKDKIELLFLCGGSQNELESQATEYIKTFSIIDSYDNHRRLKEHIGNIDTLAKQNEKIALCSLGWDPGLFSYMRGLFGAIGFEPYTFWGKGLSQGHTQAIKNIDGVIDALQFTIPDKRVISKVEKEKNCPPQNKRHKRLCYVVCKKYDETQIKRKITTMPDYFLGYDTKVKFVSQTRLNKLKNFSHQGIVTTKHSRLKFCLNAKSNPEMTAQIMLAFAKSYSYIKEQKKCGAYTIFDLPLNTILAQDKFEYL